MAEDLPEARRKVLKQLGYEHPQSFSELQDDDTPSNRFSYHLQKLVEDGYIEKTEHGYILTGKGETFVARLSEGDTVEKKQPILGIIIIVKEDDQYLVSIRKKEPFKGYTGSGPHGRISMGEFPEDAARRILRERTGLTAEHITLEGLWILNTIRDGDLLYSHYHFIVSYDVVSGTLKNNTTEFKNRWADQEQLQEMNLFQDNQHIRDIAESDGFTTLEAERFQEGTEFTDLNIIQEHKDR